MHRVQLFEVSQGVLNYLTTAPKLRVVRSQKAVNCKSYSAFRTLYRLAITNTRNQYLKIVCNVERCPTLYLIAALMRLEKMNLAITYSKKSARNYFLSSNLKQL